MIPIWKDTEARFIILKNAVTVKLSTDGEVVYKGKLVNQPGSFDVGIFVNRIAKDYLSAKIELNRVTSIQAQPNYIREFTVSPRTKSGETTFTFFADYGYDNSVVEGKVNSLARPLSYIVDPRQLLTTSVVDLTAEGVASFSLYQEQARGILTTPIEGRCQTFSYAMNERLVGFVINVVDNTTSEVLAQYKVQKTCAKYCLYYLNAHGGYDHLLINGNAMRTDKFTRTEITKSVNNATLAHSRQTIATEVTPTWKLYTDCLTDEQWKLTHHLLGSSHIFLHDLETDEITPVVITSSVAEYKSYCNQGNKKSYLTIDVEASVKRMRK